MSSEKEKGVALVVVLWITTILTLLVASFTAVVKANIVAAGAENKLTNHTVLIDSGLEYAMARVFDKQTRKAWLDPEDAQRIRIFRRPVNIRIIDPKGLVDLNKTDGNVILNLLRSFVADRSEAETILNGILLRRAGDRQKRVALNANQFNFRDVSDLLTVPGMTFDLYTRLKPFVTVHNTQGTINPASAPVIVLSAIPGLSKSDINELLKQRARNPEDQKVYAGVITRSKGILNLSTRDIFIVYVTSPYGRSKKLKGRRYVVVTGLDNKVPFRTLSWSEFAE